MLLLVETAVEGHTRFYLEMGNRAKLVWPTDEVHFNSQDLEGKALRRCVSKNPSGVESYARTVNIESSLICSGIGGSR